VGLRGSGQGFLQRGAAAGSRASTACGRSIAFAEIAALVDNVVR
jgi:hypothetical protein